MLDEERVSLALMFILFALVAVAFFLTNSDAANTPNPEIKLAPVQKEGKWGYIDKTGNFVIEAQFDEARTFCEELAVVRIDKKWGVINKAGKFIAKAHFDIIHDYREGISAVKINEKWGFIKKNGKFLIKPQFDDYDGNPINELALTEERVIINGKRGYFDKSGTFKEFEDEVHLCEGLPEAKIDGLPGYIDNSGKIFIKDNKKYVSIDKVRIFPMLEPNSLKNLCEGLALVQVDGKYGYIDKNGILIIQPQFGAAGRFQEGMAAAKRDGLWGYINKTGQFVIQPKFDLIYPPRPFREGISSIKLNDVKKWGCIDITGKIIIEAQFDEIFDFQDGVARVKVEDNYGVIDKTGKFIIKPKFEEIDIFSEEITKVKKEDKFGYINKIGTVVASPKFHWSSLRFKEGKAMVRIIESEKYSFIDKTGAFLTTETFDLARSFSNGMAMVGSQETISDSENPDNAPQIIWSFSFINETGELIVPFQFESVLDFH